MLSGSFRLQTDHAMSPLICAPDGSASAWPSVLTHRLGYIGLVNFCFVDKGPVSVRHECLQIRDTRALAMQDARDDAGKLVARWSDQIGLDDALGGLA